jgi:putative flippase GtrA
MVQSTRVSRHRFSAYRPVIVQLLRFGLVGVSNTLLTLAVYTLLVRELGVWYLLASAIGFVVGAVNGFLLNRSWTFRGHRGDAFTPLRWTVVQGCGLALDEALLYASVHALAVDKLAGQALAIVVVVLVTFFANRIWTFRMPPIAQPGAPPQPASPASPAGSRRAGTPVAQRGGGI